MIPGRTYASMVLLVMLGLAWLIPSTLILATASLSPYSGVKLTIGAFSGLYIASALMALASVPLLNKMVPEGYIMGLISCLLAFSTFIALLSLMVLGIVKDQYSYGYSSTIMLLLIVGGLSLPPELLISIFLASGLGELRKPEGVEKARVDAQA